MRVQVTKKGHNRTYGTRAMVPEGTVIDVNPRYGKIWMQLGRVQLPEGEYKAIPPRPRGSIKREKDRIRAMPQVLDELPPEVVPVRVVEEEDEGDIESFRAQYKELFDRIAKPDWSIVALKAKIRRRLERNEAVEQARDDNEE